MLRSRALGAMVAQVWQAIGSFGLQLLAAWLLGAAGLGTLSLCLSIIILATAVASGMIGDSLVILDRHDRRIRAGLQFWTLVLAGVSLIGAAVVLPLTGLLSPLEAALMAGALVAFQVEELVRRIFMATMRFWRLVIIDSAAVVTALGIVGVWASITPVRLVTFFIALLAGQLVGMAVGLVMLPRAERRLVPLRAAAVREVAGFGAWRGAQVSVAPLVLTVMRVIVAAAAGRAALGELELARIYVAPALLSLQGLGSYLLSSYVRDKQLGLTRLISRAWRSALAMMGAAIVVGAAIVAIAPQVAHVVSGPSVDVNRLTVAGWVIYVVASASCQPFASLAAAHGRPAHVLRCRIVDAGLAVVALFILLHNGIAASWTPFVLAAGLFLGGALVRQFALKPLTRSTAEPTQNIQSETSYATH